MFGLSPVNLSTEDVEYCGNGKAGRREPKERTSFSHPCGDDYLRREPEELAEMKSVIFNECVHDWFSLSGLM